MRVEHSLGGFSFRKLWWWLDDHADGIVEVLEWVIGLAALASAIYGVLQIGRGMAALTALLPEPFRAPVTQIYVGVCMLFVCWSLLRGRKS